MEGGSHRGKRETQEGREERGGKGREKMQVGRRTYRGTWENQQTTRVRHEISPELIHSRH